MTTLAAPIPADHGVDATGMIADGIYPNVASSTYFTAPEWSGRMSPSVLECAMEGYDGGGTMAHVKAAFDGNTDDSDTKALGFGRAAHCRLLEPERFKVDFAEAQQCEAETADGKRCSKRGTGRYDGQWFCSTPKHAPELPSDVEVYSPDDGEVIEAVRARIFQHPAVNILKQSGGCEVCIAWTCPRTGVKCKSRLDKWMPKVHGVDYALILDLKFVRCASEKAIRYALKDYGWARAAAMRQDGIEVLTGQRPRYCLIAVEKSKPYEISVPLIGETTMRGALWDVRTNLSTWAKCVQEGAFPGYGNDFMDVETASEELHRYKALVPDDFAEES